MPKVAATRPLLEMARGALFNIIQARLKGARVLDLYAGSGSLGVEALSRGAAGAVFVESDHAAAETISRNLENCGLAQAGRVMALAAADAVRRLPEDESFDLVFIDPPFAEGGGWESEDKPLMAEVARRLGKDGLVVFRLEDGDTPPPSWNNLPLIDQRRYGRSLLCFFSARGAVQP